MEVSELKEQINIVVEARLNAKAYSEEKSRIFEELEEKHASLFADAFNASELVKEEEARLRELTLQAYAETGNKAPAQGVGIREMTKLDYDKDTAFKWATEHVMALKLDTTAFEKIVKASPLDFVKVSLEPQATIASHLEVV